MKLMLEHACCPFTVLVFVVGCSFGQLLACVISSKVDYVLITGEKSCLFLACRIAGCPTSNLHRI